MWLSGGRVEVLTCFSGGPFGKVEVGGFSGGPFGKAEVGGLSGCTVGVV